MNAALTVVSLALGRVPFFLEPSQAFERMLNESVITEAGILPVVESPTL